MTKIEHILSEGPELSASQRRVLAVLEKHPDHVFRMYGNDLNDLVAWCSDPDSAELPSVYRTDSSYSANTVKWALSTLYRRGKIAIIDIDGHRYYGSKEAIEHASEMAQQRKTTVD